jgi:DNA modification methylase
MIERPGSSLPANGTRERGAPIRDRVVELRRVRAAELAENPRNWRRHPAVQRRALRALLREIGYADALLAREQDGGLVLVDGHLRRSLDPDRVVPVLVLDLTEEEADKLLATLDPIAALAVADPNALEALLARVNSSSAAVRDLLEGLARQAKLPIHRGLADPDEIPRRPQPRTTPGDLWMLGEHRILCGDATEEAALARVMDGTQADVFWTDPPYGVDYVGKTPAALRIERDTRAGLETLLTPAFAAADRGLRPGAALYVAHPAGVSSVVFANAFLAQGWELRQTLVWVKDQMVLGHADYHYRHEPLLYGCKPGPGRWGRGARGWYGGNAQTSVFEIPRPRVSREHPTAKPVELVRRCLANSSAPGMRVLDPFLGSGTTVIAAEQEGRICAGIELDPGYVDVAIARWEAFTGLAARRA